MINLDMDGVDPQTLEIVKAGLKKQRPNLSEDQCTGLARALIKTNSLQVKQMLEEAKNG